MNGRFLGVKKTWLLRGIAVVNLLIFAGLVCLCVLYLKIPSLWFYSFCLCVGAYELAKGLMFKFDSAFYFGVLLINIGISGFDFFLLDLRSYAIFFIAVAFILASVSTFLVYHQKFHLILAYSLTFLTLYGFLLRKNLITTPIFIAFAVYFLVQLGISIILNIKKGL